MMQRSALHRLTIAALVASVAAVVPGMLRAVTGHAAPAPQAVPTSSSSSVRYGVWDPYSSQWMYSCVPTYGTFSISSLTSSGKIATGVAAANHGLATGDTVEISGASPTEYNGTFQVTVTSASAFTYDFGGSASSSASGTVVGQPKVRISAAEGDIVEIRAADATATGISVDVASLIDTTPTPASLGIPAPATAPAGTGGTCGDPLANSPALSANGPAIFGKLKTSTPEYRDILSGESLNDASGNADPNKVRRVDQTVGATSVEVDTPNYWDVSAIDAGGSVGLYPSATVSVAGSAGTVPVAFDWDISRWAKGDVFVNLNASAIKVIDKDGNFKRYLATSDLERQGTYHWSADWSSRTLDIPAPNKMTYNSGDAGAIQMDVTSRGPSVYGAAQLVNAATVLANPTTTSADVSGVVNFLYEYALIGSGATVSSAPVDDTSYLYVGEVMEVVDTQNDQVLGTVTITGVDSGNSAVTWSPALGTAPVAGDELSWNDTTYPYVIVHNGAASSGLTIASLSGKTVTFGTPLAQAPAVGDTISYTGELQDGGAATIGGNITGCAVNWHTGNTYVTNFDSFDPGVSVIERQPGTLDAVHGHLPYSDLSQRISTRIQKSDDPTGYPVDENPESVAFDGAGNMYVGHSFPYSTPAWTYTDAHGQVTVDFNNIVWGLDETGAYVSTGIDYSSGIHAALGSLSDPGPGTLTLDADGLPKAYWFDPSTNQWTVNQAGKRVQFMNILGKDLQRYVPDANEPGGFLLDRVFSTFTSNQGTDWVDVGADQHTIYYTSEYPRVYRFNTAVDGSKLQPTAGNDVMGTWNGQNVSVWTGQQETDFGKTSNLSNAHRFHTVRLLPPGDGTGGFLVAAETAILRIDQFGNEVQRYTIEDDQDAYNYKVATGYPAPDGHVGLWYTLEVNPDGRTFWATAHDTGWIYEFDIASGRLLDRKHAVQFVPKSGGSPGRMVEGMCVMWQYTAAHEICGDGIDNDGNGIIDDNCAAIPVCSGSTNDPSCGAPTAADDTYTTPYYTTLSVPASGVLGNDHAGPGLPEVSAISVTDVGGQAANVGQQITLADGNKITVNADGSLIFVPRVGFSGAEPGIEYRIGDPSGGYATATINISVNARIGGPTAADDTYSTPYHTNLSVAAPGILGNDQPGPGVPAVAAISVTSVNGDTANVNQAITLASGNQITVRSDGSLAFAPKVGYFGVETIPYQIGDPSGDHATATISITVIQELNLLIAVNDSATISQSSPVVPVTVPVLANDSDPNGDLFQVVDSGGTPAPFTSDATVTTGSTGFPQGSTQTGAVSWQRLAPNASYPSGRCCVAVYTPPAGFFGAVSIPYSIKDQPPANTPLTKTAHLNITVTGSLLLHAHSDFYAVARGTASRQVNGAGGVLANDDPADFSGLVVSYWTWGSQPTTHLPVDQRYALENGQGYLTMHADGSFLWEPSGTATTGSAYYHTIDTQGQLGQATLTFHVNGVNAVGDSVSMAKSATPIGHSIDVLANDFDPESDPFALKSDGNGNYPVDVTFTQPVVANSAAPGGTVALGGSSAAKSVCCELVYTPAVGFAGVATFTYTVQDNPSPINGVSIPPAANTATVTVTVVNQPPTADAVTAPSTDQNTPVSVTLSSADSDSAASPGLTFAVVTPPSHGTLGSLGAAVCTTPPSGGSQCTAAVTYTPGTSFNANDSFTYQTTDEDGATSNVATATLRITPLSTTTVATNTPTEYGTSASLTATVACANQPAVDGTVTFKTGTTVLASQVPVTNGTATFSTPSLAVGTYPIEADFDGGSLCPTSSGSTSHVVTARPLFITANDQTKSYGTAFTFVGTEFSTSGLVLTDSVASATLTSAGAGATAGAGSSPYAIVPSAAQGSGLGNYTISYVNGSLTVTPLTLTIKANDRSKTYGQALSFAGTEFAITSGSLLSGDSIQSVTLSSLGTAAGAGVAGSPYTITAGNAAGPGAGNYTITYAPGALTVGLASLTVTANAATRTYGGSNPVFTGTVVGALGADGITASYSTTSGATASVGDYAGAIVASLNDPNGKLGNYTVTNTPGTLHVVPASLTVVANNKTKIEGAPNPVLDGILTGVVTGDDITATYATTATQASPVGAYPITPTLVDPQGRLVNYAVTITPGTLTVLASNQPPVAVADAATTTGTAPVGVKVLTNDYDPDAGDTIHLVSATQPVVQNTSTPKGAVSINVATGTVTYTAPALFTGVVTFNYTVADSKGATSTATVTITVLPAEVCYVGASAPQLSATQQFWANADGTITVHTVLSRNFVDNTYGVNAIGWPGRGRDGNGNHTFSQLVGSDHIQMAMFDATGAKAMEFDEDYLSASTTVPSGYRSLGVTGGDGKMLQGSAANVVGATTSLDQNFNHFGYVLTSDSPATDANYTPNPSYPNWVFDVSYDVTLNPAAFGSAGFGYPRITDMHASPSKTGSNSEPLTVVDCGGGTTPPPGNHPPVALDDSANAVIAGAPVVVPVLANDSDPDGDALTVTAATAGANGTTDVNANGTVTYTPASTFVGIDQFTYTIGDGHGGTATATVMITVNGCVGDHGHPDNDDYTHPDADDCGGLPAAIGDSYNTGTDRPLTARASGVLGNDVLPKVSGGAYVAVLVSTAAHGTVALQPDGSFVYTPDAGFTGVDRFTYAVGYGAITTSPAVVAITVAGVGPCTGDGDHDDRRHPNDDDCTGGKPRAANDRFDVAIGQTLTVPAPGILANDQDPQHAALSAVLVKTVSHGTLAFESDGSFAYTPATNFTGTDAFTYQASNGQQTSKTATVKLTVGGPNCAGDNDDRDKDGRGAGPGRGHGGPHGGDDHKNGCAPTSPTAANDSYSTVQGTTLTVSAPGVMTNDSDPQHLAMTSALVSSVSHGTLTLAADGSFVYKPTSSFTGTDSFSYKVSNGSATSDTATVTITVTPPPPVAVNDSYTTGPDQTLHVDPKSGVLGNDTDSQNRKLTAVLVSTTAHGKLTLKADGSFDYDPDKTFAGQDTFTYQASAGSQLSNVVTVTITVLAPPPVAGNDAYTTPNGQTLTVSASGVLGNDSGTGSLTVILVSSTSHGTLTLNANGSFTYKPAADFAGNDTFTYRVKDATGATSNVSTVTITVEACPGAHDHDYRTSKNHSSSGNVLDDCDNPSGHRLSADVDSGPKHGSVTWNGDGSFSYTPDRNYSGSDSFTFHAIDSHGNRSKVQTVMFSVK